ncbi:MAG: DUF1134 domain-containing protein [Candidatus Rokubacteria bacterium]|nr:DUF1134 domain-containing protein [Candidatus Rokubacteria bacterium]
MARAWIWVVAAALVCFGGMAAADDEPSGTVTIESKSVALGVGVSWGDGKLSYQGKTHTFSVNGFSVVDVGVSKVSARGKVFHLNKLEDFAGTYAAAQAGAAVGGGMSAVALRNQNGVVLELTSTQTGIKFTLAGEGIEVKLK